MVIQYTTQFLQAFIKNPISNIKMLIKSQTIITLPHTVQKILHIFPTYNQTNLMLSIQNHLTEQLIHFNKQHKIIKQKTFQHSSLTEMEMINDRCAVILDRGNNLILQWNIQTDVFLEVPFMYLSEEISEIYQLHIFNQTHTFCILELGNQKSNILKLSYFKYPLQPNEDPILTYENQQTWTHNHLAKKANNHSMICWFEMYLDTNPIIHIFYLTPSKQYQGVYRECNIAEVGNWGQFKDLEISVSQIWEIRPFCFFIVAITDQAYDDAKGIYPNTNFVYSALEKTFRRTLFTLPGNHKNQYIDCHPMGPISTIRTYKFTKGISQPSQIYYIQNTTEKILATQKWQCSHLYKYQLIASMPGLLIQCVYQNINVEKVEINVKEILSQKLICCFFMEEIVGDWGCDCDGDLVQFVAEIFQVDGL